MTYRWDFFISYRRAGNVQGWVKNHFRHVLQNCLEDEIDSPRIFVDEEIEVGAHWPDELAATLLASRYMVAILSPPYFTSTWCMAEWATMRRRERIVGMGNVKQPRGLIFPVVFSDGESFPEDAKKVQAVTNLSKFGFPYEQFSRTDAYIEFHSRVREFSQTLIRHFNSAPEWDAGWPVVRPLAYRQAAPPFPRLG